MLSGKIQFYSTLAVLAGVSIGPILSTHVSYQKIWVLVSIGLGLLVGLVGFWIFWQLPPLVKSQTVDGKAQSQVVKTKLDIWQF